jgi:transketolase
MSFAASVHQKAIDLIKLSIEMTTAAGSGHPTSAASLAHLVTVLLYNHLRYDPAEPDHPAADRLVLSEGHACPIVYAAAADLGMAIGRDRAHRRRMTRRDALMLRSIQSEIDGHPNPAEGFPFFPAATGSLGQGLSVAAGLALAARLDASQKRIYCIVGDGESREGQIWEAVDFITDYRLKPVCGIFNCNAYGQSDRVSHQQSPEVLEAKLRAAGWLVRVIDGHDPLDVQAALKQHAALSHAPGARPFGILARTVKGWGFPSFQGGGFHGTAVSPALKDKALAELDETARQFGAAYVEGELQIPSAMASAPEERPPWRKVPSFCESLRRFGKEDRVKKGRLAPRKAYGMALRALGHSRPEVVALDCDVRNSTHSQEFHDDPELEHRFFECRTAEQNMISCAAGLAAAGKLPFASTFGKFQIRALDQLEMALLSRVNLKLVGSHVGVTPSADGPSQMALADLSFFRAYSAVRRRSGGPDLYILTPSDGYGAYGLTLAMADHQGPCYLRTLRPDVPLLYDSRTHFTLGGHQVLFQGSSLLIAASGYMVHEALKALKSLAEHGIEATLVDLYSLPFDRQEIVDLAAANQGRVLTIEDSYGGGIGSEVAEALSEQGGPFSLEQMFVRRFPKSGRTPDELLRYLGLSADDIVRTGISMLKETVV